MTIRVYFNLHKKCWSVLKREPGKGWRLCTHTNFLALNNVRPVIHKHGQERTRREGKKYVHAYLEGEVETGLFDLTPHHKQLSYVPMIHDTFVWRDDYTEFTQSRQVVLTERRAWALR